MREEDPFKGKRLLILGKVIPERKAMHVSIVENELKEMKFEVMETCAEISAEGWFLDTWNATAYRANSIMLTYVKTGQTPKGFSSFTRDTLEHIPGIPEMTKLEEIEIPEVKNQVKTASTAKKFGI